MMTELTGLLLQAADGAYSVGSGRIVGGWDYVWASYGLAWATIALYGLSLWVRAGRRTAGENR
jgi:hypothetical protein